MTEYQKLVQQIAEDVLEHTSSRDEMEGNLDHYLQGLQGDVMAEMEKQVRENEYVFEDDEE